MAEFYVLSLYSAITANPVFSPDKAKTEKKKKFLFFGVFFSFPAFVRLLCNGTEKGRQRRGVLRGRGPFPATSQQIFANFRKKVRGLKLYYGSNIFRRGCLARVFDAESETAQVDVCDVV